MTPDYACLCVSALPMPTNASPASSQSTILSAAQQAHN